MEIMNAGLIGKEDGNLGAGEIPAVCPGRIRKHRRSGGALGGPGDPRQSWRLSSPGRNIIGIIRRSC